jgi:hypothetical protein
MSQEIYRDPFGVILHDPAADVLELRWSAGTTGMNDDDFMAWLTRYADAATSTRAPHLLIDVTRFSFSPGQHVGAWRDEQIIPTYNAAGVRKFAFLVREGSAGTVESGASPAVEPPGNFPTGYFDARPDVDAWFAA